MTELIIWDRIEELEEYISNFPNSIMTPIFKREIELLKEEYNSKYF